ncbi:MAG: glycosyltransferase family 2 protein, partial [Acidimicrobiales bacterium]
MLDPTTPGPDVSVIIVSYHCRDDVLACVDSVLTGVFDHTLEVLVVDNGSTDGTVEALRAEFGEVTVLEMGVNAGFARANNRGIATSTGRHVLVLNPDTVIEAGALDRMVDWADDHPWAGVVAPALVYPDGRDQQTARSFPTPAATPGRCPSSTTSTAAPTSTGATTTPPSRGTPPAGPPPARWLPAA